jgi:hypothetical protein
MGHAPSFAALDARQRPVRASLQTGEQRSRGRLDVRSARFDLTAEYV